MVHFSTLLYTLLPAAIASAAVLPPPEQLSMRDSDGELAKRIYGGTPVTPAEFHALVHVQIGPAACGGTLVSKNLVVTAAHCVKGFSPNSVRVLLGTHDLSQPGFLSDVSQIIVSDSFKGPADGDIALLRLTQDFSQTPKIGYARLPEQGSDPLGGDPGLVAGWGSRQDATISNKAYKTSLPFISRDDCRAKYGYVADGGICAGGKPDGHGTCDSDTGGPLLNHRNGNFVGVASASFGACGSDKPYVFTRVGLYVDWIKSHM